MAHNWMISGISHATHRRLMAKNRGHDRCRLTTASERQADIPRPRVSLVALPPTAWIAKREAAPIPPV